MMVKYDVGNINLSLLDLVNDLRDIIKDKSPTLISEISEGFCKFRILSSSIKAEFTYLSDEKRKIKRLIVFITYYSTSLKHYCYVKEELTKDMIYKLDIRRYFLYKLILCYND